MMEPDLRDLLSAWLGTECEAPRYDELLARVRQDETFRRAFVSEIRMLGMLKVVQSAEPMFLYCATGPHCQTGQVMVINPYVSLCVLKVNCVLISK